MTFSSSLTNAGVTTAPVNGHIPPDFGGLSRTEYGNCSDVFSDCGITGVYAIDQFEGVVYNGGTLEGTVVPIPAAAWLFGSALAGLGWMRPKQTA